MRKYNSVIVDCFKNYFQVLVVPPFKVLINFVIADNTHTHTHTYIYYIYIHIYIVTSKLRAHAELRG